MITGSLPIISSKAPNKRPRVLPMGEHFKQTSHLVHEPTTGTSPPLHILRPPPCPEPHQLLDSNCRPDVQKLQRRQFPKKGNARASMEIYREIPKMSKSYMPKLMVSGVDFSWSTIPRAPLSNFRTSPGIIISGEVRSAGKSKGNLPFQETPILRNTQIGNTEEAGMLLTLSWSPCTMPSLLQTEAHCVTREVAW